MTTQSLIVECDRIDRMLRELAKPEEQAAQLSQEIRQRTAKLADDSSTVREIHSR